MARPGFKGQPTTGSVERTPDESPEITSIRGLASSHRRHIADFYAAQYRADRTATLNARGGAAGDSLDLISRLFQPYQTFEE